MSINNVGSNSALMVQSLVALRAQLDDLQRQLGTGKKADTYAGVGLDRGLAVGLRAQVTAIASYQGTVATVGTSLQVAQSSLGRMEEIGRSVRSSTQFAPYDLDNTGQTTGQGNARAQLDEFLNLLNTPAGDRYLFSGRALDRPATDTLSRILEGDPTHAGFKQVMAERNQADLGAGLGRLVIPPPPGNVVSVSEDVAGSPFGFKLAGISSTLTNAVVIGPGGVPPAISVDFTAGNPNSGDTIKFSFALPDGSSEDLTLTATTSTTPAPGEFTIGATPAATATNLQGALVSAVGKLARTALLAASSVAAGNDFFDVDAANPPRRVAGPPFDTATALVPGTAADTVTWYTGELQNGPNDPARATAVARVDTVLNVPYGMRSTEAAIRRTVQDIAIFAAATFSPSAPDDLARYQALTSRLGPSLAGGVGQQKISEISADLATAQATLGTAKDRHREHNAILSNMLGQIENAPIDEVGAKLLALQTNLQASLETTAQLFRLSLVNFL
jgi:flagellin-like hook-associated protein FlgL